MPHGLLLALADQIPQREVERPGATRVEVDQQSGISIGYRRHYSAAKGKHFLNFEAVFGASTGVTAGLKMARTA
jgi:hypothetical protein